MKMDGFSLIEIMISSFILALGLLGLAGMQSTALKSTIEIQQRTLANSLIADISERMQLNRQWLKEPSNSYAIASLMNTDLSAPSCVSSTGVFTNCSGEDIKKNDLFEWKNKFIGANVSSSNGLNHGLVEADACIEVDSDGRSVIVVSWYSTLKSKDAAAGKALTDLAAKCGTSGASRRQIVMKTLAGKSL
ncbi:type IV pilus modification protein PilV [Psychromonas sp. MME2]|uniref:type IV pilus modification protein PilV n=1 Tax=unclassified Psychromonas TaxID=2614957 RepID=UPI00339C0504